MPRFSYNVYIDRNDELSNELPVRSISNENEIKKFVIAKLHNMHFKEQVNLFHNAECIVGLHGGGFGNIVFCKPGTKIVELKSSSAGYVIKNLAKKNDLNYISLEAKAKEIYKFEFPNQQGSIHIPISRLSKVIEN